MTDLHLAFELAVDEVAGASAIAQRAEKSNFEASFQYVKDDVITKRMYTDIVRNWSCIWYGQQELEAYVKTLDKKKLEESSHSSGRPLSPWCEQPSNIRNRAVKGAQTSHITGRWPR